MMKTCASSLNPFAVSYVPLAKREVHVGDECMTISWEASVDNLKLKDPQADDDRSTRTEIPQGMDSNVMDEQSEMDLAYLEMMFPGVSDQFLTDVYNVNQGDLEAAMDMLSELESADDQRDALDIDNTQTYVSSTECSSVKAVSVAGESSMFSASSEATVSTS